MNLVRALALLLSLLLLTPARAAPHLMDQEGFQACEAEAFLALVVARNAMHLGNSQASQRAVPSNGDFALATIDEVYETLARTGSKDHGGFAAAKFYQCSERERLGLRANPSGAAVCLARQDLVFFLHAERLRGRAPAEAVARVKQLFGPSSPAVYPPALIDQLAPMVYRVQSGDDEYELRRFVFETCLFPSEWQAWYESTQQPAR